jgi:hypothetical protein
VTGQHRHRITGIAIGLLGIAVQGSISCNRPREGDEAVSRGDGHMTDRGLPYQVRILEDAIGKMGAYHRMHGFYAGAWHFLDIEAACGGYMVGDPGTRPKPGDGARWRPKNCKSTYVIQRADATHVLIQAINDRGEVEYEIEQGMKEARPVNPPKD